MTASDWAPASPHARPEVQTLTVLRAVAALWVVFHHFNHHVTPSFASAFLQYGTLAVDLFFGLSGFIMVYVYRDTARFGPFLMKRIARLYPVHLVTMLGVIALTLAARILQMPTDDPLDPWEITMHILMIHGWGTITDLHLNPPSWSISAEFAAYLLFPFLVRWVYRLTLPVAVGLAFATLVACWLIAEATGAPLMLRYIDFSPLRILPQFLAGMVAARIVLERRVNPNWLAAASLTALAGSIFFSNVFFFALAVPPGIMALYLLDRPMPVALVYLGTISYSLYMVHVPVEKVGYTILEKLLGTEILPNWTMFVMFAIALAVASAMYHLVEQPCRRWIVRKFA